MGLFESLESEYVGGVTIPTQVIKYNHFPPRQIRLQYSHQIKLYKDKEQCVNYNTQII